MKTLRAHVATTPGHTRGDGLMSAPLRQQTPLSTPPWMPGRHSLTSPFERRCLASMWGCSERPANAMDPRRRDASDLIKKRLLLASPHITSSCRFRRGTFCKRICVRVSVSRRTAAFGGSSLSSFSPATTTRCRRGGKVKARFTRQVSLVAP